MRQTQPNSMAERGFVSKLGEKRLTVGRKRGTSLASAQSAPRLHGPRSNTLRLLSSLIEVLHYTAWYSFLLGNLQCTADSLIESLMAVRLYTDAWKGDDMEDPGKAVSQTEATKVRVLVDKVA